MSARARQSGTKGRIRGRMAREKAKEKRRGDERKRRDPGVPHPEIRNGMNARNTSIAQDRGTARERERESESATPREHTTTLPPTPAPVPSRGTRAHEGRSSRRVLTKKGTYT